jgi:hypothetical protein
MTQLDRSAKLAATTVAAIATLGATGAQATVAVTPLASTDTSVSFANGASIDFVDGTGFGTIFVPGGFIPYSYNNLTANASGDVQVSNTVAAGSSIGSATTWTATTEVAGKSTVGQTLYLPFELTGTSGNDYGYVTLDVSRAPEAGAWAYTLDSVTLQDDGSPITVGGGVSPVPEPSSLALLAVGALGLVAYRRRQHA